ncbi:hypothetical protein PsorP6_006083 [Peronosclerospora sorghi]|uniref:Uncharacterized protein n=1 Tax=Peronosclerospora sorghi TaxID=230839 RepID=A0ACC0W2I9_9STRA|nr:hypothetical protein PsorP6_006083 [Peronosclerospora sorghi]
MQVNVILGCEHSSIGIRCLRSPTGKNATNHFPGECALHFQLTQGYCRFTCSGGTDGGCKKESQPAHGKKQASVQMFPTFHLETRSREEMV